MLSRLDKESSGIVAIQENSNRLIGEMAYLQAGSYKFDFNASDLSSGIYFYKLTAGNFVSTKKMILVK